jgi:hypothetical protein
MLSRAVMGFAAGAVVAVVEADVLGWDAEANDEAPNATKETTLKVVPPKIRARPRVAILIVLLLFAWPWGTPIVGGTGEDLDWIAPQSE